MKHLKLFILLFVLTCTVSCGQQKKYITYSVQQGETMRSIARKLDMKTRDLMRLNPDISRKPVANTEIVIPNNGKIIPVIKTPDTNPVIDDIVTVKDSLDAIRDQFVLHKVNKGDTFYSLIRYYNVLKFDLLLLNPELSDGLKLGSTIKIKEIVEGDAFDVIYKDTIESDVAVNIGLLLPFRAHLFDTIAPQDIFQSKGLVDIVTDFYLGAELAIDSLRNQGVQIELSVFDTEDRDTKINEIIATNQLDGMDAVIGPLYSDETVKTSHSINVPVVFPVFSKVQTSFAASNIIKTSPDKSRYKEVLLSHISERYTNENIIIVGDSTEASMIELKQIASVLKQHDSIDTVHEIIPHHGYIEQQRFLNIMKPDTTAINNWVIITTKNSVIASDALNSLISFPEPEKPEEPEEGEEPEEPKEKINYDVKVFSFEKGTIFDKVDNNKLAQLGFVFVADTYVDESSTAAITFNNQYQRKNNTYPSYYATRGFDVMYDIIMRLASGESLKSTFNNGVSYRLESKFDYQKRLFGITENKGLFLLEYNPDLSIKRLK